VIVALVFEEDAERTTVSEKQNTGRKGPPGRTGRPFLFWTANIGWFAELATLVHAITVSIAAG
jgi:hypothetical protein